MVFVDSVQYIAGIVTWVAHISTFHDHLPISFSALRPVWLKHVLIDSKTYSGNTKWYCNEVAFIFLCIVHLRDTLK